MQNNFGVLSGQESVGRGVGGGHQAWPRSESRRLAFPRLRFKSALADLERAISDHMKMKEHLEAILALQEGRANGRGKKLRGKASSNKVTLRQAILDVLGRSRKPLKPVELRDKLLASGYSTSATLQNFYISVFTTAGKEPGIAKTKAGFSIRKRSGGKKTVTSKKKGKAKRREKK